MAMVPLQTGREKSHDDPRQIANNPARRPSISPAVSINSEWSICLVTVGVPGRASGRNEDREALQESTQVEREARAVEEAVAVAVGVAARSIVVEGDSSS